MRVFELHFNPETRKDIIFDTFYYEPEDVYEKRLGYLFMAGELRNVLARNERLLKNLARVLKTKFYGFKTFSAQSSLKKGLKAGNAFLEELAQQGDVSWLTNLNFAILVLTPYLGAKRRKYKLNFTKVGDIKIFLLRQSKILDIARDLDLKEIEPYPIKVFLNVLAGNIQTDDKILILTQDIYKAFNQIGLIEKIAYLSKINEKVLNNFFGRIKAEVAGACLFIDLAEIESQKQPDQKRKIIFKEKIALKGPLRGFIGGLNGLQKTFKEGAKRRYNALGLTIQKKLEKIEIIKIPVFPKKYFQKYFSQIEAQFVQFKLLVKAKNTVLVICFICLLILGGLYAKIDEKKRIEQTKNFLAGVQEKISQAESFVILKENNKASEILLNIWQEIVPLTKTKTPLMAHILITKEKVEQTLFELNNLEKIEEPELIFEFKTGEFLPQKIISFEDKIYFFSPYLENIYELNQEGNISRLDSGQKFKSAILSDNSILFISTTNQFFPLKNNNFGAPFSFELPSRDFEFENAVSFKSNIYLLEENGLKVFKYPYLGEQRWGNPEIWFENTSCGSVSCSANSMAIDGSVWLLRKDNLIEKYYGHQLEKTIKINIFPIPQEFTKIWAPPALSYLYILEPTGKRIIILDKTGEIIRQYQSEKFDNLKDFVVSLDGKEIYLLNNQKLFKITPDF